MLFGMQRWLLESKELFFGAKRLFQRRLVGQRSQRRL